MVIDILSARISLEPLIQGLATGSGVSFGDKSIIIYVSDYSKEQEIRSRIGTQYEGFNLRFITSGKIQFIPQSTGLIFQ